MPSKVYVIGLDGMMFTMYKRFVAEGILPNLKRLGDEGVVSESYSSFPPWTPTNWATLMTGAHTGTHTVSRWFLNFPSPRDQQRALSAFASSAVAAETVFQAADKAGLKSIAVHYPASSSRAELAHTVDGFGHPGYGTSPFEVTPALGYTNVDGITNSYQVRLQPAENWQNLPASKSPPLEFPIDIVTKREGENQTLMCLAIDAQGDGYDTVVICDSRDGTAELARSPVGKWTDWIYRKFIIEGTEQEAAFRLKTIELAKDASRLRLYRSQVMLVDGVTEPVELGRELVARYGPYMEHASVLPHIWGIADVDTSMEEVDYQCQWIAKVGKYLFEERGYSLLYTHIHLFDHVNHGFAAVVDPACPGYDPAKAEEGWHAYREAYKAADRFFGTLMENAPDDTAVLIVSDHAAVPQVRGTDVYLLLRDKGYMVLKDPSKPFDPADNIDLERSKVFVPPGPSLEIFVNAPEGSEEYTRIQNEVLTLLRTWVDKTTGKCPVVVALPKRHSSLLGYWGDQSGDIVFFMEDGYVSGYPGYGGGEARGDDPYVWIPEQFGAQHGPYLPTARTDVCTNSAFFLGSGPGLKKGYERPLDRLGYMHQTDVVAIVCHLLGIDPPDQCQGTVPRDFLEGTKSVMDRSTELPEWEWGTRLDGWGDRVWTQKRDMFEGFMPGYERRE